MQTSFYNNNNRYKYKFFFFSLNMINMIGIKNLIRHLKILLYISFSWRFFLSWRLYKKNRKKKKYETRNKKNKKKFFFNFLYLFLFFLFPSICNDPKDRNKRRKGNDLLLRWILETRLSITKCKSSLLVRVDTKIYIKKRYILARCLLQS